MLRKKSLRFGDVVIAASFLHLCTIILIINYHVSVSSQNDVQGIFRESKLSRAFKVVASTPTVATPSVSPPPPPPPAPSPNQPDIKEIDIKQFVKNMSLTDFTCFVETQEKYTFYLGDEQSEIARIEIPILRQSLYKLDFENQIKNLSVVQWPPETPSEKRIVIKRYFPERVFDELTNPFDNSDIEFIIVIEFDNPQKVQVFQIMIHYEMDGYYHSGTGKDTLNWGMHWINTDVEKLTIQQYLPPNFITDQSTLEMQVLSDVAQVDRQILNNCTLLQYSVNTNIPENRFFLVQTKFESKGLRCGYERRPVIVIILVTIGISICFSGVITFVLALFGYFTYQHVKQGKGLFTGEENSTTYERQRDPDDENDPIISRLGGVRFQNSSYRKDHVEDDDNFHVSSKGNGPSSSYGSVSTGAQ